MKEGAVCRNANANQNANRNSTLTTSVSIPMDQAITRAFKRPVLGVQILSQSLEAQIKEGFFHARSWRPLKPPRERPAAGIEMCRRQAAMTMGHP